MPRIRKIAILGLGLAAAGLLAFYLADPARLNAARDSLSSSPSKAAATSKRQAAATIAVRTAASKRDDFPIKVRSIGFAEPIASVVVKSRIDSQIVEQKIVEGQFVAKGDLLFVLDDTELRAELAKDEAALARDIAVHDRTVADRKRKEELVAKGATSPQAVDQAVSDEKVGAASIAADKASIESTRQKLSYAKIYSQIAGRAGAVQITPGNLIGTNAAGAGLVTITQMQPIRVSFAVPERELGAVKAAIAANVPPLVRVFATGNKVALAEGRLSFLDSSVDIASGTVTVKATFDNADLALWPGQYLDVELEVSKLRDIVVVPSIAVQTGQIGTFVYVVTTGDTVDLRKVTVAAIDGDRTALSDGLADGERVVVEGQLRLTSGAHVQDLTIDQSAGEARPAPPGRPLEDGSKQP